jgi:hypothetical protein
VGRYFLTTNISYAKVLKDDLYLLSTKEFTFKYVCQKMIGKVYPLIESKNISEVDCMKEVVNVTKFCEKELVEDPYLARGKVVDNKVQCVSSSRVIFKYECDKGESLCDDHEIGCFQVKEKLATRLQINHSSITDKNILNCYFSKNSIDLDLNTF